MVDIKHNFRKGQKVEIIEGEYYGREGIITNAKQIRCWVDIGLKKPICFNFKSLKVTKENPPFRFSIRSLMYTKLHVSWQKPLLVDGPWRESPEEAATAYKEMLDNRDLIKYKCNTPYMVKECDKESSTMSDSLHYFKTCEYDDGLTTRLLFFAGVQLNPIGLIIHGLKY